MYLLIIERRGVPWFVRGITCPNIWTLLFFVSVYDTDDWILRIRWVADYDPDTSGTSYDRNL